jgi:4-amino-4-deoxy-L-arabinose transferase-like glycosyltransferase
MDALLPALRARSGLAAAGLVLGTSAAHVWYAGRLPLSGQEAYYWQQARHLALSYLEHPPLAAWTIHATTALLGETERGVRLAATLHAAVAAGFFFLAGRRLFGGGVALVALLAALATPLFALGQSAISSDTPLLAGAMAALYFTARALEEGRGRWLAAAGAAVGWAALGKYTGWLLAPQILAALWLDPRGRRLLRSPGPWIGLALAGAAFAPVLVWNARNGWASFAFHLADRAAALDPPGLDRLMRFFGLQALLVTPILGGVVFVAAFAAALRAREHAGLRLCAVFALPPLVLFSALAPFAWVKASWLAPAYPAALLAAAAFLAEAPEERRGVAIAAVAIAGAATTWLHVAGIWPALPFPARQVVTQGWRELAARVDAERRRIAGPSFVLGCGSRTASALAFYLPGRPETLSVTAFGERGLQYDLWFREEAVRGREGILVVDRRERNTCRSRADVCAPLERLRPLVVRRARQPVTTFELWRCRYPDAVAGSARAEPR